MARKRLSPVHLFTPDADPAVATPPVAASGHRPPVAQVAGDASAHAALDALAAEMASARAEGRLVIDVALEAIDEGYLVRDRIAADPEALDALVESIRARGQQTPIDVVALEGGRYGLVSGWRRLRAIQALRVEYDGTEPYFDKIRAVLRQPETAAEAYLAMIEENEIRVGLSYYERARIAWVAAEQGLYRSPEVAVRYLFANGSRARRSKIGSFVAIVTALDGVLKFPSAIPERLGLSVARALDTVPGMRGRIIDALEAKPVFTAEEEQARLAEAVRPVPKARGPIEGVRVTAAKPGKVTLSGAGVTEALVRDLRAWLAAREG